VERQDDLHNMFVTRPDLKPADGDPCGGHLLRIPSTPGPLNLQITMSFVEIAVAVRVVEH